MYVFIRNIFLKFFIFTDIISDVFKNIYEFYIEYQDKYIKYAKRIIIGLLFIFIIAYNANSKVISLTSAWVIGLMIIVPYLVIRIHLCTNSIYYFLYTILIVFVLVCLIISSYIGSGFYLSKLTYLIYLVLCIFFSLIAKKDVALIGNEVIGTIATFIYTLIMHYKDNISKYVKGLFLNTPARLELTAKDIQEIESFDSFITQATSGFLIIIFISVISIMLIHLKEYCNNKYLKDTIGKCDENI
jgi:hypothetical protein